MRGLRSRRGHRAAPSAPRTTRWPTTLAVGLVVLLASTAAAGAAITPAPGITLIRIAGQRVTPGYGETVRIGQVVPVSGAVSHPPARAGLRLQGRTSGAWHTELTASLHGGRFLLHWHVRSTISQLRVALLAAGHVVAVTRAASLLVGPAIVLCRAAAAPTALPAGDGWIAGGVYLQGGPAPGIDQCQGRPSTITVSSMSGSVVTSQMLEGGDGYALIVPAGTYQLTDSGCQGTATVTAGRRTVADTDCDFP